MADLTEKIKKYTGNAFSRAADFVERHAYEAKLSLLLIPFAAFGYGCAQTKIVSHPEYKGDLECPMEVILPSGNAHIVMGTAKYSEEGPVSTMKFSIKDSTYLENKLVNGSITYTDIQGRDMVFKTKENNRWKKYIIEADSVKFTGIYAGEHDSITVSPRGMAAVVTNLEKNANTRRKAGFPDNASVSDQQAEQCVLDIVGIQENFYTGQDFMANKNINYFKDRANQGKKAITTPVDRSTLNLLFEKN